MSEVATVSLCVLLALYVSIFVSIFLHELGHVLFGKLAGAIPTSFGLGRGRVFFVRSFGGTRFYLGGRGFGTGLTFALFPQLLPERWQLILFAAGGIIANCIMAALAYALASHWPIASLSPYFYILGGVNVLLVVKAAIPLAVRVGPAVLSTDGHLILFRWLGRQTESVAALLRTAESLSPLFHEIGELRCLRAHLVQAAELWCALGDATRAGELLDTAESLPVDPLPPHRAWEMLVRASAASAADDLVRAEALCAEAEEAFRRLKHENGLLLAAIEMGWLILMRGNRREVKEYYERVAPILGARLGKRTGSASFSRLLVCLRAFSEGTDAEGFLAAYEATPARLRTPLQDLQSYRFAARYMASAASYDPAATAYVRALDAVTTLDRTLAETDRERFRLAQAGLIAEARACMRRIGREDDPAKWESFFPTEAENEQKKIAAREKSDKRWKRAMRWGQALTLLNVVVTAALILYFEMGERDIDHGSGDGTFSGGWLEALAMVTSGSLLLWTAIAVVIALPLAAASRWIRGLRRISTVLTVSFAIIPWVMGPALFIALVVFAGPRAGNRPPRSPRRQMPHQLRHQQPRLAADVQPHAVKRHLQ